MNEKTKELLEKQLELLSERSKNCDDSDLSRVSDSMAEIADAIIRLEEQTRWQFSWRALMDQALEQHKAKSLID